RDAMRDANDLAKNAQQQSRQVIAAENRAWLGIKEVDLDTVVDHPLKITAVVTNSGKAPAISVRIRARCIWGPNVSVSNPPTPPSWGIRFVALPNSEYRFPCYSDNKLTDADVKALVAGLSTVVYVGEIEYTDRFGESHHTTFCRHTLAHIRTIALCP